MNGHDHSHSGPSRGAEPVSTARLAGAAGVNTGFAVVQIVVGLALGSVVVLADSLHQIIDAVGLLTALAALRLLQRPATSAMTFGWGKADALGGYTSGLLLLGSIAWVVYESIQRLFDPVVVDGGGVILIGLAGMAVNGISVLALGHGEQLSLKAARLHLLVDLAGSGIVVLAGILLRGGGATWVDPVASLAVNALVLRGTWSLLRNASAELLDRSPNDDAATDVQELLNGTAGISNVHHVHTRSIAPGVASVTAHVVMDASVSLHDAQEHMHALQAELAERLGIAHSTIQLECHSCEDVVH